MVCDLNLPPSYATTHLMSSRGLPTRSRLVSEFMMGLEKTKAKAGEASVSARALELRDMHRLYRHCVTNPAVSPEERRQGIVRYVSVHFLGHQFNSQLSLSVHICLRSSWFFALMRPCP